MKTGRISLALFGLLLIGSYTLYRKPRFTRAQTGHDAGTPHGGERHNPARHEIDFPYYSLRDGFDSTLRLVSDWPEPLGFVITVYSLSGEAVVAPTMRILPQEKLTVDLARLLTELGADVGGDFAEGSVSVQYRANGSMPLVGQITIENPELHLVYESQMVENDPEMSDIPPVLDGLWWGLAPGRDATLAISNASDRHASADVFLDFQGARHASSSLRFGPHETKVLSVIQLLSDLGVSLAGAPEGGITIAARGNKPTVIAHGHILDPSTGFSTTLNFPLPQRQLASALHASGVPIGTPSKDSPYAGAGTFTPHVIVRNLAASTQEVTITVEYPGENGPEQTVLSPLSLGPYSTQDISLDSVAGQWPLPLPFCSMRIQYSGVSGSAMAEVASVEENRDLVIDSKLANESDSSTGSGAYPWHLDDETESTLFLTNMGDKPSRIGFQVQANGVRYYLTKLRLDPHETRAIDLRKLRDAQEPDFQKNTIPAQATDGSVLWAKFENVPVMGRMVVLQRRKGLASSYSCFDCRCGSVQTFISVSVSPASTTALLGDRQQFTCIEKKQDCHGTYFFYDITTLTAWISSNTGVATIDTTGLATAVGGGSAGLTASFTDTQYDWDFAHDNCVEKQITNSDSAMCTVQVPTYVGFYSSGTDSVQCPNSNFFARRLQVKYQVLDSSSPPAPIRRAGMTVAEQLSWMSSQCATSDQCGQKPSASSWTTDSNGVITEPDQIYNCSATCVGGGSCTEAWEQTFYVNGQSVWIVNGTTVGTRNCISTDCTHTPSGTTK